MNPRHSTETFVVNAIAVHGDKYDYSNVEYVNSRTKVKIHCNLHGAFEQSPRGHLLGQGCPTCGNIAQGLARRLSINTFVAKAEKVHNAKYDYSRVEYVNNRTKVEITCPTHGTFFQTPNDHLGGKGCTACGTERRVASRSSDTSKFVAKARKVHSDTYDYSAVTYVNSATKVIIICPLHGEFMQAPAHHLNGAACPKCYHERSSERLRDDADTFIKKSQNVHGDKYDYSAVTYVDSQTKVTIKCAVHGEFEQRPNAHLCGQGCPSCGKTNMAAMQRGDADTFIKKAQTIHGDKYDYSAVTYVDSQTKVTIKCAVHGEFEQRPNAQLCGQGCPSCGKAASAPELEIKSLIESYGLQVEHRVRPAYLNGKELDLYVPDLKLAIEYCGSHVHNADVNVLGGAPKAKSYHYDKWKLCYANGVTLLTVFDFMWLHKRSQVEALIIHKLGINQKRIYARKCKVVNLDRATCWDFVSANHISGTGVWKHTCTYKGLMHEDKIVAVMVEQEGDIKRACVARGVSVVGGISKLFKSFPVGTQMVTTNDTGSSGNYGVRLVKTTLRYWWVNVNTLEYLSRNACMKHKLEARFGVPVNDQTEVEYMLARGYVRVFDSGLSYFVNA